MVAIEHFFGFKHTVIGLELNKIIVGVETVGKTATDKQTAYFKYLCTQRGNVEVDVRIANGFIDISTRSMFELIQIIQHSDITKQIKIYPAELIMDELEYF